MIHSLPNRWCKLPGWFCLLVTLWFFAGCADEMPEELHERSRDTPQWFDDGKLGIFIHWGLPSVPAFAAGDPLQPGELEKILLEDGQRDEMPYSEWYYSTMQLPGSATRAYHDRTYGADAPYDIFQPMFEENVQQWDPDAWAQLFAEAGAHYVVLVTKHHDGYTLWPSAVGNPNKVGWGSPRDLVGELAAAVRARGLRFGTYYSTGFDWTFKLATGSDQITNLMRSAPSSQAYADYTYAHMRELIDRYQPAVLWADIGYPSRGRLGELFEYYFATVPDGVVNDRWGAVDVLGRIASWPGGAWLLKALARWSISNRESDLVDDPARLGYKTEEYTNLSGIAPFKWESTRGLGGSFGFNRTETAEDMLTGEELVSYLVDTVAKNGNVLINVGPDSFGQIPAMQQRPLQELGAWLAVNGEAIYGTRPWQRYGNAGAHQPELRFTEADGVLYVISPAPLSAELLLAELGKQVQTAELLGYGPLSFSGDESELRVALPDTGVAVSPAYTVKLSFAR
jgi:alpha-L-fucosidase